MDKKIITIGAVAIIFIGAAVGSFFYKNLTERPNFSEVTVQKGNLEEVLNLNGKVKSENDADLGFEIGGRITALTHKVGDYVEKDEVLARADDESLTDGYKEEAALLKSAEANLEYYQGLLGAAKNKLTSLKKTSASSSDKDAQRNQIKASEAQVEAQEANIEASVASVQGAEAQIEKTIIRAPFSGVLAKQDVEVGEVAPSNGAILTLINKDDFKVETFASEIDAKNIKIGNEAEITLDNDAGETYSAHVTAVDPAATLQNNVSTYKVTLNFDEKTENIDSGTDANVKISAENKTDIIAIPKDAIYTENNKSFVYASRNGIREKQTVSTGIYGDNNMVEITSGLQEGDKIFKLAN
jgi:HlyD family secretion protein